MPAFEVWDIVKIPHLAGGAQEYRPLLVIGAGRLQSNHDLLWVLMITSAANPPWPGDVPITDLTTAGLPAPSVVRCAKITTIGVARAQKIGALLRPAERAAIARHLALVVGPATGRQTND